MKNSARTTLALSVFISNALIAMQQSYVLTEKQEADWRVIKKAFKDADLEPKGSSKESDTVHDQVTQILANHPILHLTCFAYLAKEHYLICREDLWLLEICMDYSIKYYLNQRALQTHIAQHNLNGLIKRLEKLQRKNNSKLEELNALQLKTNTHACHAAENMQWDELHTLERIVRRTKNAEQLPPLIAQLTALQKHYVEDAAAPAEASDKRISTTMKN